MKQATQTIDRRFTVGEVGKDMYGVFIESAQGLDKVFYGPENGEKINGFDKAQVEAMRSFMPGGLRYPGGNYVSNYDWRDGVGPVQDRPVRCNLPHAALNRGVVKDDNRLGINEFHAYAKTCGMDSMITVNLGTGDASLAAAEMEYCNIPGGTYWSDLRRAHGFEQPHQIQYWFLGNEMDGGWQIGQQTAQSYALKAREAAQMMRVLSPDAKLIVCGSTNHRMPAFPEWDRIVLETTMPYIDWISIHHIFSYSARFKLSDDDPRITLEDVPFLPLDVSRHIEATKAIIDFVRAKKNWSKDVKIMMDEFAFPGIHAEVSKDLNWTEITQPTVEGILPLDPAQPLSMFYARILAAPLLNAVITGGTFIACLNHADVMAGTCHGFHLLQTENGVLIPADAYPFQHVSRYGRGTVLRSNLCSPMVETAHYGQAPAIQTATVYNQDEHMLTIFAVNMDLREDIEYVFDVSGFKSAALEEHILMYDDQPFAGNTPQQPDRIHPIHTPVEADQRKIVLPKHSWSVLRLRVGEEA